MTVSLPESVSFGNAFTGSGGLLFGQDTMKALARLYTSFRSSGASNGCGNGDWRSPARMYDEWRLSTVRMDPAAVRYVLSTMLAAAPR